MSAIVRPGEIPSPDSSTPPPPLRLAPHHVFAERARRFEHLAKGHPMADYLLFMARVATAQQTLLDDKSLHFAAPDKALASRLRKEGRPPLDVEMVRRAPVWQGTLQRLLASVRPNAPVPTRAMIDVLAEADADAIDVMAERALRGFDDTRDPIADPLLAAAMQVYWVRMGAALKPDDIVIVESAALCPVCGSAPVASVIHGSGPERGLRYLHCGLCESEWHLPRVRCSQCDTEKDVVYFDADGAAAPVSAEACEACRSYLKLIHRDKDAAADAIADDLASLHLDMAMALEGFARSGPNLLFVPGEDANN